MHLPVIAPPKVELHLVGLPTLPQPSPVGAVEFLGEFPDSHPTTNIRHLSPSHLRDRAYCAAQNWYTRTHKMRQPVGTSLMRGTCIHRGLNMAMYENRTTFEQGRVHPISLDEFLKIAQHHAFKTAEREWRAARNGEGVKPEARWTKGPLCEDLQTLRYDAYRVIKHAGPYFYENVYPIAVEAAFLLYWRTEHILPMLAIADIVELREDLRIGIRDVKTSIRRKSLAELAFDRGLVAYAGSASEHYGLDVSHIAYDNITFSSPGKGAKIRKPLIKIATTGDGNALELPYEPATLETLHIECADAMLDLEDTRITPRRSTQTCVSCAFKERCAIDFGPFHPYLIHGSDDSNGEDQ